MTQWLLGKYFKDVHVCKMWQNKAENFGEVFLKLDLKGVGLGMQGKIRVGLLTLPAE